MGGCRNTKKREEKLICTNTSAIQHTQILGKTEAATACSKGAASSFKKVEATSYNLLKKSSNCLHKGATIACTFYKQCAYHILENL